MRPLHPAPAQAVPSTTLTQGRSTTASACDGCRSRKSKCDANRPRCSSCITGGTECVYERAPNDTPTRAWKRKHNEVQSRHEVSEELNHFLETGHRDEAEAILDLIRDGVNEESRLRSFQDNRRPSLQPSLQPDIPALERQGELDSSVYRPLNKFDPPRGPHHRGNDRAQRAPARHAGSSREIHSTSSWASQTLRELQELPEDEAAQLLDDLRRDTAASDSEAPRKAAKKDTLILARPPSEQNLVRGILPSTQNGLEFELTVRHPIAYPTLCPIDITTLPWDVLSRPNRLERSHSETKPSQHAFRRQTSLRSSITTRGTSSCFTADIEQQGTGVASRSDIQMPLIDERLHRVKIHYWTQVPISDELAIQIISLYLELDYSAMPLFHAGLFLDDLVQQHSRFCSSFLINALLCFGCEIYTGINPQAATFTVAFYSEARRQWAEESHYNRLTTVAGLNLLSMAAITYGRDDIAGQLLDAGLRMGRQLGLFDCDPDFGLSGGNSPNQSNSDAQKLTASYTAWGVFNWAIVYDLHYQTMCINRPPTLPGPADIRSSHDPPGIMHHLLDVQVFQSRCDISLIIHDIFLRKRDRDFQLPHFSSLVLAEETYHRLLSWARSLPFSLTRQERSTHAVFLIHIYFHATIIDLFRPFLHGPWQDAKLKSFSTSNATPKAVYSASLNQLKRLLLTYRLKFKTATLSVLWQTAVVYVANGMMREAHSARSAEWHFYLDLCMACLEDLAYSFRVFETIAHALLGMALQHGVISVQKANRMVAKLRELVRHHVAIEDPEASRDPVRWIIDLDLGVTDPGAAHGSQLAERFQKLLVKENSNVDQQGDTDEREDEASNRM